MLWSEQIVIVLGIAGIICLVYYLVCGLYAGFGVSYLWIWLAGGLLCLAGALFLLKKNDIWGDCCLPAALRILLISVLVVAALLFVFTEAHVIGNMFQKGERDLDYVIVLGAQVKKDRPSLALLHRIETAGKYLQENPHTVAILSGGQGLDEPRSEAECMEEGLLSMGIAPERLILEDKSTDTVENFRFSLEYIEDPDAKIGFITSNFHVFRAGGIAEGQVGHKISGIAAPSHSLLQVHYMVREFFAILKDTLTGRMKW